MGFLLSFFSFLFPVKKVWLIGVCVCGAGCVGSWRRQTVGCHVRGRDGVEDVYEVAGRWRRGRHGWLDGHG